MVEPQYAHLAMFGFLSLFRTNYLPDSVMEKINHIQMFTLYIDSLLSKIEIIKQKTQVTYE